MAGRGSKSEAEKACQTLLKKLQHGQGDLHRSLEHIRAKKSSPRLRVTRVRYKPAGNSPLCCVRHLPVRRARTEQLSPDTPPSPHGVKRKYRRRLSSTPKQNLSPSHTSPPSLLLHHSHVTTHPSHSAHTTPGNKLQSQSHASTRKQVKKIKFERTDSVNYEDEQKSEGGGSRDMDAGDSSSMSVSQVAKKSASLCSRYGSMGKKKSRGLTVSFISDENLPSRSKSTSGAQQSDCGGGQRKRRSGEMSFTEEKWKGEALVNSLNSSRFGGLEHHRKCGQPHAKLLRLSTSQRWSGEDPALGYDWIAGLVEAGSVLEGREDGYFEEMREFRKVNHSECSRPHPIFLPNTTDEDSSSPLPPPHPSLSTTHTHCTQSYVLNDRLFPVSQRDSGASGEGGRRCPVCEGRRRDGGEEKKPPVRYIRVSVPRSSVKAPYQLRPHRRRSFDPSDSMALNKHCLAGWNSTRPPSLPPQPTVDLKSATRHGSDTGPVLTSRPTHDHHHHTRENKRQTRSRTRADVSQRLLNHSHTTEYCLRSRDVHA